MFDNNTYLYISAADYYTLRLNSLIAHLKTFTTSKSLWKRRCLAIRMNLNQRLLL